MGKDRYARLSLPRPRISSATQRITLAEAVAPPTPTP